MATANVFTTHVDGGLGLSAFDEDRIHAKVGEADGGESHKVYEVLNFAQAKEIFKRGTLLESLRQYFEEFDESKGEVPQPVLCIRPVNDIPGIVKPVVKNGTGLAKNPTITGTPTTDTEAIFKITKGGACGVAEYRLSVDGGLTYDPPIVTAISNSPLALAAGISLTFSDDAATPSDTFAAGDEWFFSITGPTASEESTINAIEKLKREYRARWIHVVRGVKRAFAVSCEHILTEMETKHHLPSFIILEGESFESAMPLGTKETPENIKAYYKSIVEEWDSFASPTGRVVVVNSQGRYIQGGIRAAGGLTNLTASLGEWRNAATFLTARLSAGAVNVSAAHVDKNRSLTFSGIRHWDTGYRDCIETLHDLGHTVLKVYDDYEGVFIARDKIKAKRDSDFQEIPERRRADKMHRIVYRESLPFLNGDSALTNLDYLQASIGAIISSKMQRPSEEEISGFKIVMDPERKFASTGVLWCDLIMTVGKRFKEIRWRTSFAPTEK